MQQGELDVQLHRAVKTLRNVRRFSNEDSEPCRVIAGLFIGKLTCQRLMQY